MVPETINVAIVDDHTLFRKTLKSYISAKSNINVVIHSEDVEDFLSKVNNVSVQVLLLDLFLPKLSGIEAVKVIKSEYPGIKILVLSMCTDISLLNDLLDVGVFGIISKADEPEELIQAIVSVSEQRIFRSRLFTEVMYWSKQNNIKKISELSKVYLNEREKEVLQLLWEEKSNKEIASHLFLSVRSVEKIRQDLKEKLSIKSTIGLLKYAIREKIIQVNNMEQIRLT
jgi:DNA-binding NarL/FixJ family response regulator